MSSLPEEIIWFEPPTVCRWETLNETAMSEKIENKPCDTDLVIQHSIKSKSKHSKRSEIVIEDFNLLNIPSRVDINFVIKEIIVPRLPDGYTIRLSKEPTRRRSAVEIESLNAGDKPNKSDDFQIQSTKYFLVRTDSPRPLFPKLDSKIDVKVIERKSHDEASTSGSNEFLFSKLLQELHELHEKQMPYVYRQMDELSEVLSMSVLNEGEHEESDDDANVDDMSMLKDDFAWNIGRKTGVAAEPIEDVIDNESEYDSDESDDYDDG